MRIVILLSIAAAAPLFSQPAFDVASIKPWASREVGGVYSYPGGRMEFRGCTLEYLIEQAFNVQAFQVSGGPGWMNQERFDIDAKVPESSASAKSIPPYPKAPPTNEQRQMLQSLLIARFGLKYHRATTEANVYLLVKGNKPFRMTDSKDKKAYPWSRPDAGFIATNENMDDLAWRISRYVEKPVLNRSGLEGSFDFPGLGTASGDTQPDLVISILSGIQELGLKLETGKASVETIVIEHAEKPSAN